jgi:hypothetical protein
MSSAEKEPLFNSETPKKFYFAQKPRSYSTTADDTEIAAGLLSRSQSFAPSLQIEGIFSSKIKFIYPLILNFFQRKKPKEIK